MSTTEKMSQSLSVQAQKVAALVQALLGANVGREDDSNPLPPGPWDPVVRSALQRSNTLGMFFDFRSQTEIMQIVLASIVSRHPEIWDVIGGWGRNPAELAGLNPQPLPPRSVFLTALVQTVVERAELIQEVSASLANAGEQQGIIIVGGYLERLVDELCGNGFRVRYPFPGPRPHWFPDGLDGTDLVVMAAAFDQAAKEAYRPEFGQALQDASAKLTEVGFGRL